MYSFQQIAEILNTTIEGHTSQTINYLAVDSRKLFFPAETLFFALPSAKRDGHQFLSEAYNQGARSFVISHPLDLKPFPEAGFIQVENTLGALRLLAEIHRKKFNYPVIGITGSNGKTIVKEWLNQLLQNDFNIVRSPKSFNSQIGVPLSVWQMGNQHNLGIFEAGISLPNEMEKLEKIIQPTIGVLTNIGTAHDEGFIDKKQKLNEKLQLFKGVEKLVCCFDDTIIKETVKQSKIPFFSWGKDESCAIILKNIEKTTNGTVITVNYQTSDILYQTSVFKIPFTDDASIENAMHCYCTCKILGLETETIATKMLDLHAVEMRLEWKKAINNCYLINDSYSNDISSLIIALDYLKQQQQSKKETVILSDIFQSSLPEQDLYLQVASLLAQKNIDRIICIGDTITAYHQLFEAENIVTETFSSTGAFLETLTASTFEDESILLKGARIFGFERIAQHLEQQVHQTVLEINLTALTYNLNQYRQLLKPATKIMVMVKAFGYGSGGAEIAKQLQFNKVDYLAVAYADEGVDLRRAGIILPIMVMNPEPATFENLFEFNLEPEIYSFPILQSFLHYCKTQGIGEYPIHIKFDTGMHRLGFEAFEVEKLAEILLSQNIVKVKSAFTHLAASEDEKHDDFTLEQAHIFNKCCGMLQQKTGYSFICHAANTASISRHPLLQMDMVRLGIGIYGVDSANKIILQNVSTLKTTIAQIKHVKKGESVGYSRSEFMEEDSQIATIRIGYADGFRRRLGNGIGSVFINGRSAPIVGRIAMDMTMINITKISNAEVDDEVEIFGPNIPIQQLAAWCGTIPYEIMTGIGQRVKRVYVQE